MKAQSPKPLAGFQKLQYGFAAWIRDPHQTATPADIEQRRMQIYRELFYNNIQDFMASNFPVLRSLYLDTDWHDLVQGFFTRHRSKTPHFPELSMEFLNYLTEEFEPRDCDPPFMQELAHYEWLEAAVMIAQDDLDDVEVDPNGGLLAGHPLISPLAWRMGYVWPVHEISADNRPQTPPPQPTHVVVYRDRADKVGFLLLNPVTARLLELLEDDRTLTGRRALEQIATELNHPQPETIIQAGLETLQQLRDKDIVLGAV